MSGKNPLLKPILKWAGGKRQLLTEIKKYIPKRGIDLYVEPFFGGGAVLLDLQPNKAIINDYNPELINVYQVVRDKPGALIDLLKKHEEKDDSDYFYSIRALDRSDKIKELSDEEKAARIIYLNKTCYNGLFRVNSQGQLNAPYGHYKHPNIVNEAGINALHSYLKDNDITIKCGDYADVLKDLDTKTKTFVYFDPPYMPLNSSSSFTGYTEGGFDYKEQERLHGECLALKNNGIKFLESNSDTPEIRKLYKDKGIKIHTVSAKRAINSRGDKRGNVNEVLIKSW